MNKYLISLWLILSLSGSLYSQNIPYNVEFQVSAYTFGDQQRFPTITSLTNGCFVICWEQEYQDGSWEGIFGQLFDAAGNKQGDKFQVNTYTEYGQRFPTITSLPDSCFVVCWVSEYQDGSLDGVFGQLFDAAGNKLGAEFQVNTYTLSYQRSPSVTSLSNGGFVVCWQSLYQDGPDAAIFGQRFDATGNKQGEEFRVNSTTNWQKSPSVASLVNGDFVVCWINFDQDGSRIYGQRFDTAGNKKGTEFKINTYTHNEFYPPTVASLVNGDFVVCWQGRDAVEYYGRIYGQRFDAAGNKQGAEFQVNSSTQLLYTSTKVTSLTNGGFVVCWDSYTSDGPPCRIHGQLFDAGGNKHGPEFLVTNNTQYQHRSPSATTLVNGGFVVCWGRFSPFDIVGKYFLEGPLLHPLSPFILQKPTNDATLLTVNAEFRWAQPSKIRKCYPWEIEYDLYLSTEQAFSQLIVIENIQDTTYTIESLAAFKTYFWKVLAKNSAGDRLWSTQQDWGFYIDPNASGVPIIPEESSTTNFTLYQNYPNPFNTNTEIKYLLPHGKQSYHVIIKIYDVLGRLVKVLLDEVQTASLHSLVWDGIDMIGHPVSSGVYFYTLQVDEFKLIKKMLLSR